MSSTAKSWGKSLQGRFFYEDEKSYGCCIIYGMCSYHAVCNSSDRISSRQKRSCDLGLFWDRCTERNDPVFNGRIQCFSGWIRGNTCVCSVFWLWETVDTGNCFRWASGSGYPGRMQHGILYPAWIIRRYFRCGYQLGRIYRRSAGIHNDGRKTLWHSICNQLYCSVLQQRYVWCSRNRLSGWEHNMGRIPWNGKSTDKRRCLRIRKRSNKHRWRYFPVLTVALYSRRLLHRHWRRSRCLQINAGNDRRWFLDKRVCKLDTVWRKQ